MSVATMEIGRDSTGNFSRVANHRHQHEPRASGRRSVVLALSHILGAAAQVRDFGLVVPIEMHWTLVA